MLSNNKCPRVSKLIAVRTHNLYAPLVSLEKPMVTSPAVISNCLPRIESLLYFSNLVMFNFSETSLSVPVPVHTVERGV
jgi:hypothetical protein